MDAAATFEGTLSARRLRRHRHHGVRSIRIPGIGRIMFSDDPGDATLLSREWFSSALSCVHRRDGEVIAERDFGSGKVTNVGVLAMANDFAWAGVSGETMATLAQSNWHATGTGSGAAAVEQIELESPQAPTATTAVKGTQSLVSAAKSQTYKTVATFKYTSELAITEWGLFNGKELSSTLGSPNTASSATEATVTGTPLSASSATARGQQQQVFVYATAGSWGLCLSSTTSKVVVPAWYKKSNGEAGATPGATEAYKIQPVMWDRKQFAALNVINGDEIEWRYSLLINSGG